MACHWGVGAPSLPRSPPLFFYSSFYSPAALHGRPKAEAESTDMARSLALSPAAIVTTPQHGLGSWPGTELKPSCSFPVARERGPIYYPHFTDEETEAGKLTDMPKATQPGLEHTPLLLDATTLQHHPQNHKHTGPLGRAQLASSPS